jgi:3',5'-cyclic AMP phosphodiesterase CpdA
MAYTLEYNLTYNQNLPGKTFLQWLNTLEYSDLDGLFPELSEADWLVKKAQLIEFWSSARPIPGVTPGVTGFVETINDDSVKLVITFDDAAGFYIYDAYCSANRNNDLAITPGFSFQVLSQALEPYPFIMNGRSITRTTDSHGQAQTTTTNPAPLGQWLLTKHDIFYKTVKTCKPV